MTTELGAAGAAALGSLRQSDFLDAMERTMPVGLFAVDAEERLYYANDAFSRMTGRPVEEMLGARAPFVFWPTDYLPRWRQILTRHMRGGPLEQSGDAPFLRADGRVIRARLISAPFAGAGAGPTRLLAAVGSPEPGRMMPEMQEKMISALAGIKFILESRIKRAREAERVRGEIEMALAMVMDLLVECGRPGSFHWDSAGGYFDNDEDSACN